LHRFARGISDRATGEPTQTTAIGFPPSGVVAQLSIAIGPLQSSAAHAAQRMRIDPLGGGSSWPNADRRQYGRFAKR